MKLQSSVASSAQPCGARPDAGAFSAAAAQRCLAWIAAAALLAGCGQKGALKLPAPPAMPAVTATGSATPSTSLPATAASKPTNLPAIR